MSWYLIFIFVVMIPRIRVTFENKIYLIDRMLGVFIALMEGYMVITYTLPSSMS